MKLVLILDAWHPIVGGGQKLFLELATRLVKHHRCQIEIITRALKDDQGKKFTANEKLLNGRLIITRLGPTTRWSNLFARIWFTLQSTVVALQRNCDLYLASTFLPAISLKIIKFFKPTPNCLVAIGFGAANKFYTYLEKFLTQTFKYDLLITDDLTFFKQIKSKANIKFIPNGVKIPPKSKSHKWPDFTFLFVGRNEPRKGVNVLNKAFSQIKPKFPQAKLRLIGPGFKTVSQKQLNQELFKAHCLVLPSLKEGHPLILFEAWAHQLPVIATKVGSVPRFVNSTNCYLIPPKDSSALTRVMKLAIKNQYLKVLGKNGLNLVKNYTWSKTVNQYYQSLSSLRQ